MSVKIQLRRDISSVWISQNPILALGEPGFETDTNQFKIGNGSGVWTSLDYMRQDFVSVVAPTGINSLTLLQQDTIKEGSLILTSDGFRWFYTGGSGVKTDEASYVKVADVSPDWAQIVSIPARLTDVAGLTPTDNGVIIGNGSNFVLESGATLKTSLGLTIGTDVQAYDVELAAIAGLTSAANKGIQFTGAGTASTFDLTTAGKALLDDVDASAQRTTLGLAIGSQVQAYDVELAAIAGLTSAADKGIQFTGAGTASTFDLTTAGKALLDDVDASAQRTTLGLDSVYTGSSSITLVGTLSNLTTTDQSVSLAGGATTVSTATTTDLTLATNINVTSANIIVRGGANGNVDINSVGTGNLNITAAGHTVLSGGGGANIVIHGGADSPIGINSIGAGNVNIRAGSSGMVKLSGGSEANIIIDGTDTNAHVNINALGTGNITLTSGDSVLINTPAAGGSGKAIKSALNGTSYVGATAIPNIVTISQTDYDALVAASTVNANTLYIITSAQTAGLAIGSAVRKADLNYDTVVAMGTVGATQTISLTNGTVQTCTLTASTLTTFTMPTLVAGKSFLLFVNQAAGGGGTATFTSVKFPGGSAPTISATASRTDLLSFISDGSYWYGTYSQNYS